MVNNFFMEGTYKRMAQKDNTRGDTRDNISDNYRGLFKWIYMNDMQQYKKQRIRRVYPIIKCFITAIETIYYEVALSSS